MDSLKAKREDIPDKCVLHRASRLGPAAANLGEPAQSGSLGPQLPAEDGPQVQRSWQLPQWFLGRLRDQRGRGNVDLVLREIIHFFPQSQEQGKFRLGPGGFTLAVNPVLCSQVPPTMLPDGTLVVPIRDDADGSDDEEELSGIIEVSGINESGLRQII